jgi:hypothetical protein
MIYRFDEMARNRIRASLLHTAFGSNLARSARRHLQRLADKFTPNASQIYLKPKESDEVRRLLAGYVTYLSGTTTETPEQEAQKAEAMADLEKSIERLTVS